MAADSVITRRVPTALAGCGLAAAGLLLVAEFLPLLHTHEDTVASAVSHVVGTTSVGSAHGYAFVPIAVVAGLLALAVRSERGRVALLGVGVLGAVALIIALTHDLPAVHQTGLRILSGRLINVADTAAFGFYVETFAALALVMTSIGGFILLGPPASARRGRPAAASVVSKRFVR